MSGNPRNLSISGREAATYGAVVTFRNAFGETWSWTRPGPPREVVRDACDAAILRDPTFLCVAISTPASIYTDMQGRPASAANSTVQMPECHQLASAGRRHMTHPDLQGRRNW